MVKTQNWRNSFNALTGCVGLLYAATTAAAAPTATLTAPVFPYNLVTGQVTVTAEASDDIAVTGVEFYADKDWIGVDTTAPYSITLDTSSIPSGSRFTLRALAHDADGNKDWSPPQQITVHHEDRTYPLVAITTPAAGSSLTGTIDVIAVASDASGIAELLFKVDSVLRPRITTTAPFTAQYDTRSWLDGKHTLTAKATDANGHVRTSTPVSVTVNNSVTADTVRIHDDDPQISYSGEWNLDSTTTQTGNVFHWGSARRSSTPGAAVSISFSGTAVRWLGLNCKSCGVATISLDGGGAQLVSLASGVALDSPGQQARAVYTSPTLPYGVHTLTLTVQPPAAGEPDARSLVFVDGFEVSR